MTDLTFLIIIGSINMALVAALLTGMLTLAREIFRIATQIDAIERWLTTEFGDDDGDDDPDPAEESHPRNAEVVYWSGRAA